MDGLVGTKGPITRHRASTELFPTAQQVLRSRNQAQNNPPHVIVQLVYVESRRNDYATMYNLLLGPLSQVV